MIWDGDSKSWRVEFGKRVKAIRKIRGMRQEDLAERTGRSIWFVAGIEQGRSRVSREVVQVIARALDVDPGLLAEGSGELVVSSREGAVRFGCRWA